MSERRPIGEIRIGERHRKDLGDIAGLAENIRVRGLMHPIVIRPDNTLIAGYRRVKALQSLGWEDVPVTVIDIDDLILGERDENSQRKDFTVTEAVAIGRLIEVRERERAKEREAGGLKRGATNPRSGKLPEREKGETRELVGRAVGMSGRTYQDAKAVVTAAEREPARFGDIAARMEETGKVQPAAKELRRRTTVENKKNPRLGRAVRRTSTPDASALAALKGTCDAFVALDFSDLSTTRRQEIVRALTEAIRKLHRLRKRLQHGG